MRIALNDKCVNPVQNLLSLMKGNEKCRSDFKRVLDTATHKWKNEITLKQINKTNWYNYLI